MSGLRILNVFPRLIGSIAGWSGMGAPDGQSWLLERARNMGFNAIWLNPITKTSDAVVYRHGRALSGSLYAAKNHFMLDPEFSAAPAEQDNAKRGKTDDEHLRYFTAQAAEKGITVMADMVFNHVAADHPLVVEETAAIEKIKSTASSIRPILRREKRPHNDEYIDVATGMIYDVPGKPNQVMHFKFSREPDFSLLFHKTDLETWDDVAQVEYQSPAGMDYFVKGVDGKPGYWKQVIDWHLDRGFTGFRCDVAYKIPAKVWEEIIQHAHDRLPNVVFLAETVGDQGLANALETAKVTVNGKTEKAFDLAMLGLHWWNFRDQWIRDENVRLQRITRYGGAGFPDSHDTKHTVASDARYNYASSFTEDDVDRLTASICVRNYAVSALLCNSVYMQLGYELCRRQVTVFRDPKIPQYWQKIVRERDQDDNNLNLRSRIKVINDFKAKLEDAQAIVRFDKFSDMGPRLVKIECTLIHHETKEEMGKLVLCLNEKPELGPVNISEKDLGQDENDEKLKRLIIGPADDLADHKYDVHDCAAFYTPSTVAPAVRQDFSAASTSAQRSSARPPANENQQWQAPRMPAPAP